MIRIVVERSPEGRHISSFHVHGHAGYADPGKDIVCAGVSAVTVGTVNAIKSLVGTDLQVSMEKGDLFVRLPEGKRQTEHDEQLLLESMMVMLKTIEQSYADFVSINEKVK